jgi:hypothetical protein
VESYEKKYIYFFYIVIFWASALDRSERHVVLDPNLRPVGRAATPPPGGVSANLRDWPGLPVADDDAGRGTAETSFYRFANRAGQSNSV